MIRQIPLEELRARVAGQKIPISVHSGKVNPGDVFVLLPPALPTGQNAPDREEHGAGFLTEALRANPSALVCPPSFLPLLEGPAASAAACDLVLSEDTRKDLGILARALHGAGGLKIAGVTGTNGKTTTTYMLEKIFQAKGCKTGVIGTISRRWPGYEEEASLTTPGCLELHSLLARMREAGADYAFMEVSSHAIDQQRVAGIDFFAALLTNITQDHLDYHPDMEHYFQTKAALFQAPEQGGLPLADKACVINADDPYGQRLLKTLPDALGFGLGVRGGRPEDRTLRGRVLSMGRDGLRLSMRFAGQSWELASPLTGTFSAMNLLGAQALGLALGLKPEDFAALSGFAGAPGRLERVPNRAGLNIFVDYAHTPDALSKALGALRAAGFARVVTVFGCGGNRDRSKRPLMGAAVAELSDVAVLTSDNPRDEDPLAIMNDVLPGLAKCPRVISEPDRRAALALAVKLLNREDALLAAGKGHESYQLIRGVKHPFQDQTVLRELAQ
ncbi:MAG: UDP-N-acetylmuramoyl-L-alanyl-D-glutamate--2,6-diaminopimelate ligase [Desulfovibrio sp.]|jgi:UDP-N-acetylmuramoyl-L-alanyl-D-glutamate--2,6-diaminopimelate ligase|nr:UDP-N-acetylmuramoyl-L-alanyl-D-glutamate--2,6-diaminopimelate ligase [Desulfovibrio sp.]